MKFKVGDKVTVTFLPYGTIPYTKDFLGKSGTIIKKCCVTNCFIVEFSGHRARHLLKNWISLAKNQQLLFEFYNDR